jgi:lysozyme
MSANKNLSISSAGLDIIKEHEGLMLKAYKDPVGIWTIGYGHTGTAAPGQQISETQANALLMADVQTAQNAVRTMITAPLNQSQFDALVSFTFNLGSGNLQNSTLRKKVNANPADPTIRTEFMKWVNGGGRLLPGLVKRRQEEADLYFGEVKKKLLIIAILGIVALIVVVYLLLKYKK